MTDFEKDLNHFEELLQQLGYVKVIRCKDCKHWDISDGMLKDIDERVWHHCEEFESYMTNYDDALTKEYDYCSWAERKTE